MLALDPDRYDAVAESGFEDHACWPITEALLDLSRVTLGSRILDVACGTGIVARRAAVRIGPAGTAIGIDLSNGRLQQARRLAELAGLAHVSFETMDACDMRFPTASFDAVVAQFPHLPDRMVCLREALRVLKPGGRLAIGNGGRGAPAWPVAHAPEFAGPKDAIMDRVFEDLLDKFLPAALAPVTSGFIQPMVTAPDRELIEAGFAAVERWSSAHTAAFTKAADLYAFEATRNSGFRTRLSSLPPAAMERFRASFLDEASRRLLRHGVLGITTSALIAAGSKPL